MPVGESESVRREYPIACQVDALASRPGVEREKQPKAKPSAEEKETTRGVIRFRPSSKPVAASTIHSARVVVGAEIRWHKSMHKRNPLFHRRAPALSTVYPEGSPRDSSLIDISKPRGDPRKQTEESTDRVSRVVARFVDKLPLTVQPMAVRCTPLREGGRAGNAEHSCQQTGG